MANESINRRLLPIVDKPTTTTAGVTIEMYQVDGPLKVYRFRLKSAEVTMTGASGVGYGGLKLCDFDIGDILCLKTQARLTSITKSGSGIVNDWDGDFSVGTIPPSSGALSGGMLAFGTSTSLAQAVSGSTSATAELAPSLLNGFIEGSSTALDAYLNFLIDDADISDDASKLLVTGVIDIYCIHTPPASEMPSVS